MIAAAARKEINDVVAKWPPMPALELPRVANDNDGDALAVFRLRMDASDERMKVWQRETIALLERLENMARRLQRQHRYAPSSDLASIIEPVLQKISAEMAHDVGLLEADSPLYRLISTINALGHPQLAASAAMVESRYRDAVTHRLSLLKSCRDRLSSLVWDLDPDAHGGPAFANPDDLISFLES
jgi:hypothetical protein